MKLSLACCCAMLCLTAAAIAADDVVEPKPAGDGWITLFNGTDLTGWRVSENGKWKVEDGLLVANGPRSHLYSDEAFKDFVFETEIKTTPGSNSGIYFHSEYQEEGYPGKGHEVQVNVTHPDPVKSGSLYNRVKLFETPAKDGEWYLCRLTVKGNSLRVEIDDHLLYEYNEPPRVTDGRRISEGVFALQAHDPKSVVSYRNMRVKRLGGK